MDHHKAPLILLAAIALTSGGTAEPVWINLGHEECFNGRRNETCGYGQFCSTNRVKMGCRNCTDDELHLLWCESDPEEFRRRYPSCEIFCERELWRRRETELQIQIDQQVEQISGLQSTVADLQHKLNEKGEDHSSLTTVLIAVATLASLGVLALGISLLCLRREKIKNKFQKQQIGTAVLQSVPSCACFPRKKKPSAQAYEEQKDVTAAERRLLNGDLGNRLNPTAPQQPTDASNDTSNHGFNCSNENVSSGAVVYGV